MPNENDKITPQHLSNLKAVEVSFVPRGANRKTFLVLKEDDALKLQDLIAKTELKNRDAVMKVLKDAGLDDDSGDAVSGILRALAALNVSPDVLQKAAEACGVQMAAKPAVAPQVPAAPAPAAPAAPAAHQPPPPPHDPKTPVANAATPPPAAPVMKADGTLDMAAVPEHLQGVLKQLWEGNQAFAAVKKQLDDERDQRVTKEYVERASAFKFLPGVKHEDLGLVLKELAVKAPDAFGKVEAVLKAANELISKSDVLTRELGAQGNGTGGPGGTSGGASVTYEMIEQSAMAQPIAKEQGMKKEAAVTHFITKTAEGRKMYSEYRTARPQ